MQIELSFHWLTPCLSIAVEDVVPFIDMMCRSGEWIEALGQANARLTWCTNRSQADWKRNFGELLCQHVKEKQVSVFQLWFSLGTLKTFGSL